MMRLATSLLVVAVGGRAPGRAGGRRSATRPGLARGGVEHGRGHYPAWWCCTPACWSARWSRCGWRDRPFLPRAGLADARRRAGGAGAALVVHPHPRAALEHPGHRGARAAAGRPAGRTAGCAHPNYVAVVVEGVALPLVHTAWVTAVVFTVLNAALLRVRIRAENARRWHRRPGARMTASTDRSAGRRRRAGRAWPPPCTRRGPASTSWSSSRARRRSTRRAARG